MSDFEPEKMWREVIASSPMYPDGGSFYHETPTKRPATEYRRADLCGPLSDPRVVALVEALEAVASNDDAMVELPVRVRDKVDEALAALRKRATKK